MSRKQNFKVLLSLLILWGRGAVVSTFLPLYVGKIALLQMENVDFIPNFRMYTQYANLGTWILTIGIILLLFRSEIKNTLNK